MGEDVVELGDGMGELGDGMGEVGERGGEVALVGTIPRTPQHVLRVAVGTVQTVFADGSMRGGVLCRLGAGTCLALSASAGFRDWGARLPGVVRLRSGPSSKAEGV
jgi:hypothetical protein